MRPSPPFCLLFFFSLLCAVTKVRFLSNSTLYSLVYYSLERFFFSALNTPSFEPLHLGESIRCGAHFIPYSFFNLPSSMRSMHAPLHCSKLVQPLWMSHGTCKQHTRIAEIFHAGHNLIVPSPFFFHYFLEASYADERRFSVMNNLEKSIFMLLAQRAHYLAFAAECCAMERRQGTVSGDMWAACAT